MAHHQKGSKWYVDTDFINKVQYAYPGATLNHMGFGEFYLDTPDGRLDFNRMAGKDFDGQSGRSHLLQDDQNGKVIKKAIKHMERARKSERLAALETRIAKLQSKISASYKNKRVFVDVRGKTVILDFRADLPHSKMDHKLISHFAKRFFSDVAKTMRPVGGARIIFDGIEVYNRGLTLLQTVEAPTAVWNAALMASGISDEGDKLMPGELTGYGYLETHGWRVTRK